MTRIDETGRLTVSQDLPVHEDQREHDPEHAVHLALLPLDIPHDRPILLHLVIVVRVAVRFPRGELGAKGALAAGLGGEVGGGFRGERAVEVRDRVVDERLREGGAEQPGFTLRCTQSQVSRLCSGE